MTGVHAILELKGIEFEKLNSVKFLRKLFDLVCKEANFKVIHKKFHKFKPYGVTGFYLLSTSHISIHTWPEINYAALDIYTCGDRKGLDKALNILLKELSPKKIKKIIIKRG